MPRSGLDREGRLDPRKILGRRAPPTWYQLDPIVTARKTKVSAPLVHQSHSFEVPKDSTYKVALVADTHSKPHPNAKHVLAALKPDLILHGGDIGALSVLAI
jgi:hypothetical protein